MSDASDPYVYPGTDVLRNVPGLRNLEQLAGFETAKIAQRIYELQNNPVRQIRHRAFEGHSHHKHVFRDVFTWAGEFRTTMLGKAEHAGRQPTWFTPPHLLQHEAERIFGLLHRANLLRGLHRVEVAQQAARLLAEINKLHPFREGNGRTQRLFVEALSREAGYLAHFEVVSRERMVRASIEANSGRLGMMARMFEEITDWDRIHPLRRANRVSLSRGVQLERHLHRDDDRRRGLRRQTRRP